MDSSDEWLHIAGVFVDPLDADTSQLRKTPHQRNAVGVVLQCLDEAEALMQHGAAFWLDEAGCYRSEAATVCSSVLSAFDSVFQEAEFTALPSLAFTVRTFAGLADEIPSSTVAATWAIALAGAAMAALYELQDLTEARIQHAEYLGMARMALMLAGLYLQFEQIPGEHGSTSLESMLRAAVKAPSVTSASRAGKGNKEPDSVKQREAAALKKRISDAAASVAAGRPGISLKDLTSVLMGRGIASRPTLRKYLQELGYQ